MKTLPTIKKTENMIISILFSTDRPDSAVLSAFQKMLEFFSAYDFLHHINHLSIIHSIYHNHSYASKTIIHLSLKDNISDRTIYRYRKMYIRCFAYYYQKESRTEYLDESVKLLNEALSKFL